jgi:hypothetical protein
LKPSSPKQLEKRFIVRASRGCQLLTFDRHASKRVRAGPQQQSTILAAIAENAALSRLARNK